MCVCVCVPGRKAGGCLQTPAADSNTATGSAAATEGEHRHNINPDTRRHENLSLSDYIRML